MKPVFISYLLDQGYQQVFFLDPDLFFYHSPSILHAALGSHSILLSPHWRAKDPTCDPANFAILQTSGLFNAGLIGATAKGRSALRWWASVCLYECLKDPARGLFVDQAYLDILPVYFEDVGILRHRGCNVANWNQVECPRVLDQNGNPTISGEPIVFIHFTSSTIKGILSGQDSLLSGHLESYRRAVLDEIERLKPLLGSSVDRLAMPAPLLTKIGPSNENELPIGKVKDKFKSQDDFLSPQFDVANLDRFLVRKAILNSLTAQRSQLHGVLLDVGCGRMPYRPLLMQPGTRISRYIGLDLDGSCHRSTPPDLAWTPDGLIPLDSASVDSAICTEVLEHCPNPDQVLREVFRVMRPNGIFFFTVPFLWNLHEAPHDEYRYTPFALERLLRSAGFSEIKIEATGGWHASMAQMLGLWVRRSPMSPRKRRILSHLLKPVIGYLVKKDVPPKVFKEGTMITGLCGTARKPAQPG